MSRRVGIIINLFIVEVKKYGYLADRSEVVEEQKSIRGFARESQPIIRAAVMYKSTRVNMDDRERAAAMWDIMHDLQRSSVDSYDAE